MVIFETFSKRQRKGLQKEPEVFSFAAIPARYGHQFDQRLDDALSHAPFSGGRDEFCGNLVKTLISEYGLPFLVERDYCDDSRWALRRLLDARVPKLSLSRKSKQPPFWARTNTRCQSTCSPTCQRSVKVYHLGSNYRASKCTTFGDKPEGGNVPVLPESLPPTWRMYSRCNTNRQYSL